MQIKLKNIIISEQKSESDNHFGINMLSEEFIRLLQFPRQIENRMNYVVFRDERMAQLFIFSLSVKMCVN